MTVVLHHGDCLDVLKTLPDNSIDSIVTDPPYGLSDHKPDDVAECLVAWLDGKEYRPSKKGFMGRTWDAWVPGPEVWKECLRVLKPGGHLLAFAGTRSMDLMCLAIRLADFELRDAIGNAHETTSAPLLAWVYGSGFPKSLDVAKAIDKAGGMSPAEQAELLQVRREQAGLTREELAEQVGCGVENIRNWEDGRARAAGEEVEHIIPSTAYRKKLADILGYTQDERRQIGVTSDRRGDDTVIGLGHSGAITEGGNTELAQKWQGWGTALKPAWEPIILARKPLIGTVAENVLAYGTGALNIDASRIRDDVNDIFGDEPAEEVVEDEVTAVDPSEADDFFGGVSIVAKAEKKKVKAALPRAAFGSNDSASRFFYSAKAGEADRAGSKHPTVKPVALMQYLVTLVTPKGGTVMDPFAGSGTTGAAAAGAGFDVVLIEREAEYAADIRRRLVFFMADDEPTTDALVADDE